MLPLYMYFLSTHTDFITETGRILDIAINLFLHFIDRIFSRLIDNFLVVPVIIFCAMMSTKIFLVAGVSNEQDEDHLGSVIELET